MPNITVPVDPETSWIWSRNGAPDIRAVILEDLVDIVMVCGVSKKRGKYLGNSGVRVSKTDMDKIARTWLESRGYIVVSQEK